MPTRLIMPQPPQLPQPTGFPWLATCAPVIGSLALWLWLQSPFALMFALLGPVIAVASLGDGRMARGRQQRAERVRYARELAEIRVRVDDADVAQTVAIELAHPSARQLAQRASNDPERWRWESGPVPVRLGVGPVPSSTELEGEGAGDPAAVELRARAATLSHAPSVVDARRGIGVIGAPEVADAVARGIVLQALAQLPPDACTVVASGGTRWGWLAALPHPLELDDAQEARIRILTPDDEVTIAVARAAASLPRDCRVAIGAHLDRIEPLAGAPQPGDLEPEAVSTLEAAMAAAALATAARASGLVGARDGIPDRVELADLQQDASGALGAVFVAGRAPMRLDLVADGPHAVVGGTTGAGKSELLIAWIAALAATRTTSELAILLVDFKGGASFGPLERLSHCVGVITDLDGTTAVRAIESLRAELRHRERVLASIGARSIDEAGGELPRLVIAVDEFATMLHDLPDLHRLFVDIAARGRSLGVHLILCTQRPAEAVRDAVLANCGLRISLRVTDAADSMAITGIADAASIGLEQRGRCVVAVAGRGAWHAQAAIASPQQLASIVQASAGQPKPRRPWLERLPARLDHRDAIAAAVAAAGATDGGGEAGGVVLGLVDRPSLQRIDAAVWRPQTEGSLLALGAAASGKSGLVRVLGALPRTTVVRDEEALWDAVHAPPERGCLVIDDLDAMLARAGDDHAQQLVAALAMRMREGAAAGAFVAITARRITSAMSQIAPLADTRVLLRLASRQEHVIAGGTTDAWDESMPAGGAWMRGERIQISCVDDEPLAARSRRIPWPHGRLAIVLGAGERAPEVGISVSPAALMGTQDRAATDLGADDASVGSTASVVGSESEWESAWGAIDRAARTMPVAFLGCDQRAMRQLLRSAPTPPLTSGVGRWLLADGVVERLAER